MPTLDHNFVCVMKKYNRALNNISSSFTGILYVQNVRTHTKYNHRNFDSEPVNYEREIMHGSTELSTPACFTDLK